MLVPILISAGFLTGSCVFFALLLVWAERRILNYGECEIDINGGHKKLIVKGGGSLLSSLSQNDIFIPSACGGRGSCAYCKVTVLSGGGPVGPVEEPYLTPEEKAGNVRLSCQVKVRGPVRIGIPEALFSIRKYEAVLESKIALTHDMVELNLRLPPGKAFEFVAGQYVQLESVEYKGVPPVMRAYSIASPPSDGNRISLVIRRVAGGICTTWVFDHLKVGQTAVFSGPYGGFRLSTKDAPAIFIAGGSGIAPFLSMLTDIREKGTARRVVLCFGAQTRADLCKLEEMAGLEKTIGGFRFIPALSREPAGTDWKGERGMITAVVEKILKEGGFGEAYLCGSPGMIDACVKVLVAAGIGSENVYFDKF